MAKTEKPKDKPTIEEPTKDFAAETDQALKKMDDLLKKTDAVEGKIAQAMARELEALEAEATALGVTASKTVVHPGKLVKDYNAEVLKHEKLRIDRLRRRIAKAKQKMSVMDKRKKLLQARLKHPQDATPEQLAQARYELMLMKQKRWRPGVEVKPGKKAAGPIVPKRKSVYQELMNE